MTRLSSLGGDDPGGDDFEAAFDDLFPRAWTLARRIVGDRATAEDVAAEALARAYARWSRVGDLPHRDGWVLRVAANLAVDITRKRSRRRVEPWPEAGAGGSDAHHPSAREVSVEDAATGRMDMASALATLPKRQRQAVALRYLGGLSEAEVAGAMGISAGSVKTHVHRGLAALRGRLGSRAGDALELDPP